MSLGHNILGQMYFFLDFAAYYMVDIISFKGALHP